MIVTVNPQNIVLTELPFPALTICNVNQAKKSVAERYKISGYVFYSEYLLIQFLETKLHTLEEFLVNTRSTST